MSWTGWSLFVTCKIWSLLLYCYWYFFLHFVSMCLTLWVSNKWCIAKIFSPPSADGFNSILQTLVFCTPSSCLGSEKRYLYSSQSVMFFINFLTSIFHSNIQGRTLSLQTKTSTFLFDSVFRRIKHLHHEKWLTTTRRCFWMRSPPIPLLTTITSRGSFPTTSGTMVYGTMVYGTVTEEPAGTLTSCVWLSLKAMLHMPSVFISTTLTWSGTREEYSFIQDLFYRDTLEWKLSKQSIFKKSEVLLLMHKNTVKPA